MYIFTVLSHLTAHEYIKTTRVSCSNYVKRSDGKFKFILINTFYMSWKMGYLRPNHKKAFLFNLLADTSSIVLRSVLVRGLRWATSKKKILFFVCLFVKKKLHQKSVLFNKFIKLVGNYFFPWYVWQYNHCKRGWKLSGRFTFFSCWLFSYWLFCWCFFS